MFEKLSPETKIIGVEPAGAASMWASIKKNDIVSIKDMDPFVDGCAVGRPGKYTFEILRDRLETLIVVPEGKVCTTIQELYNDEGIVAEPAGALSISALDYYKDQIKGKTIVVTISGGNNDINRSEEIKRRSNEYEKQRVEEGRDF